MTIIAWNVEISNHAKSRQRTHSQFGNKQLITNFHFAVSCSKDIFDFLIEAWWYLWTNCPEVILTFTKFQTPHQEFTIQNLYALLWCKLNRSTSSQLGTKLIFKKYLSSLVANLSTSIKPKLSTSTQIMSKWFSFLFPAFLTLCQVGTKFFFPTWDEVVSEHCHFRYLWASCPQDFPTIYWEVDCRISHK